MDATIKLIKDPSAKVLLIPDSPTGADIIDDGQFPEINKTGVGNFVMRASSEIDYANNQIHITSLPLNGASRDVINKIIELRAKGNKQFQHIIRFDDRTQEGEVHIVIHLDNKESTKPDKVLKELYKKAVGLKTTFPVGIAVVDDFTLYEYGIKELLLAWIDYRLDAVRSMFLNSYQQTLNQQHMNDALILVFAKDNIDDTIKIAKESSSKKETVQKLMKRFKITSAQAEVIADMHVYQFNKDQHDKYVEVGKKLKDDIKYILEMLEDGDDKIKDYVIDQLKEGKKKYGGPRRSKIIKEDKYDTDVPDVEYVVAITENGYVKKLPADIAAIGPIGKTHSPLTALQINNRESILIIDSNGILSRIPVSEIPELTYDDIGVPLNQIFTVSGTVRAIMELPSMDILDQDNDDICIIFVTKHGLAKRVKLSEFKNLERSKKGISLEKNDELATALFSFDANARDIVFYTNSGRGIRLPITDLKQYQAASKGMPMVKLEDGELIAGASKINPNDKLLYFVTSTGNMKVTETKYLPSMKRTDELITLIKMDDDESLLGISSVNKGDVVEIYRKKTDPDEIKISDMEISMRSSSGVKLLKNLRTNPVVGYKVYKKKK